MVRSPGTSPERKKSKLDVYPMEVRDPSEREINPTLLLNYTTALSSFETPTEVCYHHSNTQQKIIINVIILKFESFVFRISW